MRLIDADKALQAAYTIYFEQEATAVAEVLSDCPTIDPESLRPKGEWVQVIRHVEFEDGFVDRLYECCSRCHEPNGGRTSDFCPNCGADMRGNPNDS